MNQTAWRPGLTFRTLLLAALVCALLPLTALAQPGTLPGAPALWLNAGKARPIYESADSGSEQTGTLEAGEAFELLSLAEPWAEILVFNPAGDRVHAFALADGLRLRTPEDAPALAVVRSADPAKRAMLTSGAAATSKSLGKYHDGVVVRLIQAPKGKSVKVQIGSLQGFMRLADLVLDGPVGSVPARIPFVSVQNPDAGSFSFRAAPSDQAEKTGALRNGEQVRVLGVTDEFAHILTPDGQTAFMMAAGLTPQPTTSDRATEGNLPRPNGSASVIDNPSGQGAHLRERASTASPSLGLFRNGTEVVVYGGNDWWKQVWVDGKTGFMMAKLIRGFVPPDQEVPGQP